MTCLESGSMDYDGSREIFTPGHGVEDDEIVKAMVKEREGGSKSCWTSTYDENGGFIR